MVHIQDNTKGKKSVYKLNSITVMLIWQMVKKEYMYMGVFGLYAYMQIVNSTINSKMDNTGTNLTLV